MSIPKFKDFGKQVNDLLFKKVYGDKKSFKTKNTVNHGELNLETSIELPKAAGANLKGTVVAKNKIEGTGATELTMTTENTIKGHIDLKHLAKGVNLRIKAGHQGKSADDVYTIAEADYRKDNLLTNLTVSHNLGKNLTVTAGGSLGLDGVVVGGEVSADTEHVSMDKLDYKVGAQYAQRDFTATVLCTTHRQKTPKDKADSDFVEFSFRQRATEDLTLGVHMKHDVSPSPKLDTVLTVGGQWAFTSNLKVKAKVNSQRIVEAAVEQRLLSPNLTFNLAARFNATKAVPLQNFGFGFTFGDN